jgi:hypothetical protein
MNSNSNDESSELDVLYKVRLNYDFEPTNSDELSIKEGDIVSVTKVLDGWSIGIYIYASTCCNY